MYPVPGLSTAHPPNEATPPVAESGFVVHVSCAPDVPLPEVIARVTELVSDETRFPLASSTCTTGWVEKAVPATVDALGEVVKTSWLAEAKVMLKALEVAVPCVGLLVAVRCSRCPSC